jgi:hypothetical protein
VSKIILDLCGGSGAWGRPYKEAGYDVRLITLPDYDVTRWREYSDLVAVVESGNVYGILAAPPCTKFSKAAWSIKKVDRDFAEGMRCVRACIDLIWAVQEQGAPLAFWSLENPQGYLYNFLGQPAYWFQPWMFGEAGFTATKRTALWGYFNPPTKTVRKRTIPFISPRSSKRDKVDKLRENVGWYKASAAERAITPPGFAQAFFKANP